MMKRVLIGLWALLAPIWAGAQIITADADVTLSWVAPTENEDGSPLTDLDGYNVYWGTTPGVYPNSFDIGSVGQTTALVTVPVTGDVTLYFVMTAYDAVGNESVYSNEASKAITIVIDYPPEPPTSLDVNMTLTCTVDVPNATCEITVQ